MCEMIEKRRQREREREREGERERQTDRDRERDRERQRETEREREREELKNKVVVNQEKLHIHDMENVLFFVEMNMTLISHKELCFHKLQSLKRENFVNSLFQTDNLAAIVNAQCH